MLYYKKESKKYERRKKEKKFIWNCEDCVHIWLKPIKKIILKNANSCMQYCTNQDMFNMSFKH